MSEKITNGTYNLLTDIGTVIEDPPIVVEIDGVGKWGLERGGQGIETLVGYALMRQKDVTLSEKPDWYTENGHPGVTAHFDDGDRERYEWEEKLDGYVMVKNE